MGFYHVQTFWNLLKIHTSRAIQTNSASTTMYVENYKLTRESVYVERTSYNIFNVLSEVGGIVSLFKIVLSFLLSNYSTLEFHLDVINNHFRIQNHQLNLKFC